MSFVYWVFEDTYRFEFPHNTGYVGVSEYPKERWYSVRAAKKIPKARLVILYEGTREECLKREYELRPNLCIGFNVVRGGNAPEPKKHGRRPPGFNFKIGRPVSKKLRTKVERALGWNTSIRKVAKLAGLMPMTVNHIKREMLERMESDPNLLKDIWKGKRFWRQRHQRVE